MIWSRLHEILHRNNAFLISTHVSPDGDCIGSQLALAWYLTANGKSVTVYNHDPVPTKFMFLEGTRHIEVEKPSGPFDVLVILDCSNPDRLAWDGYRAIAPTVVNIDHHRDNIRFGDLNIVENCAATAEIIFRYFAAHDVQYPQHVAEDLYAAIMTDTGAFRFSNTTASVLSICAELVEKGANCSRIYENVYASYSREGLLLLSRIWSTLSFHLDNRVCTMELPLKLIDELGATYGDSEGVADLTTVVDGVEVGMLIKHTENQTHFSLRSKNQVDVGRIAKKVTGGGGHSNAAGCTIEAPIEQALPEMLDLIRQELE
jgi:phosphoesterase RecJ-like protein